LRGGACSAKWPHRRDESGSKVERSREKDRQQNEGRGLKSSKADGQVPITKVWGFRNVGAPTGERRGRELKLD